MNNALLHRAGKAVTRLAWLAVLAAPLAAHAALATGRFATVAGVLAVVEVAVIGSVTLRGMRGWRLALGILVMAALLGLLGLRLGRPGWAGAAGLIAASGLSHACIHVSLLLLFARSLRPGRTALITGLATRLRGPLTPAMLAYTRSVTKAWCVFFVLQLAASAVLLAVAPRPVWSLFVNVLDGPSVVLMFAGEYAIRRWRFRDYRHISPVETFRTFALSRAAGP